MLVLAWGAGLLLATHFFGNWEDRQRNPNQTPQSVHGDGFVEVSLASSRQGHYLVNGQIDGHDVTFLLDTGATQVAIPSAGAERLGLQRGAPIIISTANVGTRVQEQKNALVAAREAGVRREAPGHAGPGAGARGGQLMRRWLTRRFSTFVCSSEQMPML